MLGDEVEVVYQTHGLFQPRVQHGAGKHLRLEFFYAIDQSQPRFAKPAQNVGQRARVVIGVVSFAIAEVGGGEGVSAFQEVFDAGHP